MTDSENHFKKIFDEITETCDCKNGYCFYRLVVTKQKPSMRLVVQLECMEKFKWILSEKMGYDVGHQISSEKWVSEGYAEKFAKVYNENDSIDDIFKKVMAML